jgi:NADH-quinone oxidoreductase subunit I
VACGLCEIACPAYCIHIEPGQNTGKQNQYERWPDVFNIDYAICIFCGNCEEACPEEAIFMSDDCEISMLDRKQMLYTKEQLLTPVVDLQKRIEFTRNMYAKWNY